MLMIVLQQEIAPNCFSTTSTLQGDIQSRQLTLILIPQEPLDPLCLALDKSKGIAQIFYENADTLGFPDFISKEFMFTPLQQNNVVISMASLTSAQISQIIEIKVADYAVKIEKAADIKGSINKISYLKIDVSSCWSEVTFSYDPDFEEETISFILEPNACVIPASAQMFPQLRVITNGTIFELAEFQVGDGPNDYKQPYNHSEVKLATLKCSEINDSDKQQQCYEIINFVTDSQDYYFGIKLMYQENGIETEVIQDSNQFEIVGSSDCAIETHLQSFIFPDGFFVYHDSFVLNESCQISNLATTVVLTGVMSTTSAEIPFTTNYTINEYGKIQYYRHDMDLTAMMIDTYSAYPQYIQYDDQDKIRGSFYYIAPATKQCIYLVVLNIINDKTVEIQFRSQHFDVCQNISENFEFTLIGPQMNVLYTEELQLDLDAQKVIVSSIYQLNTNIKQIIQRNPGSQFTVRGKSFYFASREINYSMEVIFMLIQFCYVALYISGSLIVVMIILRKQKSTE